MLERFLVALRKRREYFLSLNASFESSGLDLLVGRWRDWCNRRAMQGRVFEFSRSAIFRWLGKRKCA